MAIGSVYWNKVRYLEYILCNTVIYLQVGAVKNQSSTESKEIEKVVM